MMDMVEGRIDSIKCLQSRGPPHAATHEGIGSWLPEADVYETSSALVLNLELPGLRQEAIDVRVDRDELVVEGERHMERDQGAEQFHRVERSYGKFSRRFRLRRRKSSLRTSDHIWSTALTLVKNRCPPVSK